MTDELLIKFLLKETSEEESMAVQEWLLAEPANQAYFEQFEKIWTVSKGLALKSNVNEEQAWIKFKEKTAATNPRGAAILKIKQTFGWLKIAAVMVLVAGAWMTYSIFGRTGYTDLLASNQVIIEKLPDGSEVTLNKNSQISYAKDFKDHRSVHLTKGNVFFSVAHDKTRPFVIDIDKVSVRVVGTSFNIKHLKGQTEVVVETGIVKVSLNNDEIELHKGERVLIKGPSAKLIKETSSDQLYNYYRSKLFIANNTPLWKLIEVLNEAYNADIVIKDPSIRNLTLITTLKGTQTLDSNLENICETLDLKMERNQKQISIIANEN